MPTDTTPSLGVTQANTHHAIRSLMRPADACAVTGLSRSGMYRLVREGGFPKPLKITASASAFVTLEIQAWIDARIAERDASDAIAGEMQARQVAP